MIYTVYLPDFTKSQLSEIVALQVHLLNYAANTSSIDQVTCAAWLNAIPPITGRGEAIARWLWRSDTRKSPLQTFATDGLKKEKQNLCQQIQDDLKTFDAKSGDLLFLAIPEDEREEYELTVETIPSWKIAAWNFLQNFYKDFCSKSGFPVQLFSSGKAFNAQDFLTEFVQGNRKLHICPTCDESDYRSHLRRYILSEKDHYLPKSRYPHLSCHPLNLIPICHFCNAPKSDKDLLDSHAGTRYNLKDILLPYQENGLSSRTYLEVSPSNTTASYQFLALQPRLGETLGERIQVFCDTYEIPDRWNDPERIGQIGERLFERITEALRDAPIGFIDNSALLNVLDKLLDSLYKGQSKSPHSYAMVWWLVEIVNQEVVPIVTASSSDRRTAFLQELDILFDQQKNLYPDLVDATQIASSRNLLSSTSHCACIQAGRDIRQIAK